MSSYIDNLFEMSKSEHKLSFRIKVTPEMLKIPLGDIIDKVSPSINFEKMELGEAHIFTSWKDNQDCNASNIVIGKSIPFSIDNIFLIKEQKND